MPLKNDIEFKKKNLEQRIFSELLTHMQTIWIRTLSQNVKKT